MKTYNEMLIYNNIVNQNNIKHLTITICIFLLGAVLPCQSQDYIIFQDSSRRAVKLLSNEEIKMRKLNAHERVNFLEKGKFFQIDSSEIFLIIRKAKAFAVTVVSINGKVSQGIFYKLNKSSVEIIVYNSTVNKINIERISVEEIKTIVLDRHAGKSAGSGALIGFCLGAIAGASAPGWLSAGQAAIIAGVGFGLAGGFYGLIVGTLDQRIPIKGSLANFNKHRPKLKKHSMQ